MAAEISSSISAFDSTLDNVGRLHSHCITAADVRDRAARVRTFRDQIWPSQRPSAPPLPLPATLAPAVKTQTETVPAVPSRITVKRVLQATAAHFGTTVEDLTADSRKQPIVRRRQIAMYVSRRLTERSLPFIARKAGRKDHTTVLHAHRLIARLLAEGDTGTTDAVNAIVAKVTGGAA